MPTVRPAMSSNRYLEPRVTVASPDPPACSLEYRVLQLSSCSTSTANRRRVISQGIRSRSRSSWKSRDASSCLLPGQHRGRIGPIAAASMFHDGCRPPFIDGRYRIECTFEISSSRRNSASLSALRVRRGRDDDLHPKQVIASFVTGGSAAGCGFFHQLAEGRILGGHQCWQITNGGCRAASRRAGHLGHGVETHEDNGG